MVTRKAALEKQEHELSFTFKSVPDKPDLNEIMPVVSRAEADRALRRAAKLGHPLREPGAMAVLIDLKLSENPQFRDRPGACKLIETAAKRGDQAAARRLPECPAN